MLWPTIIPALKSRYKYRNISLNGIVSDKAWDVNIRINEKNIKLDLLGMFDFSGDLYGKTIEVELVAFLRDEAKFDDINALKRQMTQDVINARAALARAA